MILKCCFNVQVIDDEIKGSDAIFNADRIIEIFKGKKDTFYNTVSVNAAFGILINQSKDFNEINILKLLMKFN